MRAQRTNILVNLFFVFILTYLVYHSFIGNFNIQNYLIYKFEQKYFEDVNSKLEHNIEFLNKDIYALIYIDQHPDMRDEISKRKNPLPQNGEVLIKID